jgi:transposase-like protein
MAAAAKAERRSPEQWTRLVGEYEASGHSQRRFCAEHAIRQSSLRYWRRRLEQGSGAEGGQVSPGIRLVPVKVIEDAPALADSGLVVVAPRGVRVQIARGFDAGTLARVLATLEAAP